MHKDNYHYFMNLSEFAIIQIIINFFGRLTPGVGTKAFCLDQYIIMNTLGPNKQHNTASALNCIVDDTTAVCIVDLSVAM